MMLLIVFLSIVIPRKLDEIGAFLGVFPRHKIGTDRYDSIGFRIVEHDFVS
ncbi:hypothetical protein D3C73_1469200 [compost metagenome]